MHEDRLCHPLAHTPLYGHLRILCRAAFGCDLDLCTTHGLDPHATVRGSERLVARAILIDGSLVASIAVEPLRPTHPLLSAQGVWNQAVFTLHSGESVQVAGKGAGRFPTAEAVLADLFSRYPKTAIFLVGFTAGRRKSSRT